MAKYIITGQNPLSGEIKVNGAKNNCLKTIPATLMMQGISKVHNVPYIEDLHRLTELMESLGAKITIENNTCIIDPTIATGTVLNSQKHQHTRVSVMLAGPVLHRNGSIKFPYPGGCVLGKRPIDFFLNGFRQFGVVVEEQPDGVTLYKQATLKPTKIVFPRISHTATEAMMTFATLVPGTSTLVNCAMEPEVVALAEFLNSCGAKITGAGSPTITIEGVTSLSGGETITIPDRMEAGSFAALAATTQSHLKITGINPNHLDVFWEYLKLAGVKFELGVDNIEIFPSELRAIGTGVITHEYPGFPTDLQAPITVMLTQAKGNTLVFETIYDGRLFFVDSLQTMGANVLMCDPHRVLISGPSKLAGTKLVSPDIRAGMALVIAALAANGQTEIDNVYQIERGYENLVERLRGVGADILKTE
ncbi:MAG TPA: UDP-N-acetylglucosamine 1-carboxyvinyltransferase [Patescibacteria group bacterium]|nr:UDP-N-acetylglucosamine 1-carboxyvinyltransferase [Patescibacteria group bacterium]